MEKDITGIILCGGKSSRMNGNNKAFLKINKTACVKMIHNSLQKITKKILVISNNNDLQEYGFKIYPDLIKKSTPLAGIHSGLFNMTTEFAFITACDMPFLQTDLIKTIISRIDNSADIISPYNGQYYQPLCSVYSKKCIPHIEKILKSDEFKVDKLFDQVSLKTVSYEVLKKKDPHLVSFFNINTQKDYKTAVNLYKTISLNKVAIQKNRDTVFLNNQDKFHG